LRVDVHVVGETERMLAGFIEQGRVGVVAADNIGYYGPNEPLLRTGPGGMRSFWTASSAASWVGTAPR